MNVETVQMQRYLKAKMIKRVTQALSSRTKISMQRAAVKVFMTSLRAGGFLTAYYCK